MWPWHASSRSIWYFEITSNIPLIRDQKTYHREEICRKSQRTALCHASDREIVSWPKERKVWTVRSPIDRSKMILKPNECTKFKIVSWGNFFNCPRCTNDVIFSSYSVTLLIWNSRTIASVDQPYLRLLFLFFSPLMDSLKNCFMWLCPCSASVIKLIAGFFYCLIPFLSPALPICKHLVLTLGVTLAYDIHIWVNAFPLSSLIES